MLPENRGTIFQQRQKLPETLFSKEFRTATAFSSFLNLCVSLWNWPLSTSMLRLPSTHAYRVGLPLMILAHCRVLVQQGEMKLKWDPSLKGPKSRKLREQKL